MLLYSEDLRQAYLLKGTFHDISHMQKYTVDSIC